MDVIHCSILPSAPDFTSHPFAMPRGCFWNMDYFNSRLARVVLNPPRKLERNTIMTMNAVFIDPSYSDDVRREKIYAGQLIICSPTPSSLELVDFAKTMLKEAFGSLDPETAQFHLEVEKYAALLADLKPKFIHHPKSKECIRGMLRELGFDLEKTYFDVPRMRSSTSDDYLTT